MKVKQGYVRRRYAEYNKKYFGNKLPKRIPIQFTHLASSDNYIGEPLGETTIEANEKATIIELNKKLRWSHILVDMMLLHEMVHVENPGWAHDSTNDEKKFLKRIRKNVRAGAYDDIL